MKVYSTYRTISLISAPKIHTDLIWDLTILFAVIAVVYFAFIFFFRNKISKQSRETSILKTKISPMISKFIFHEESASKEEKSHYINLKVEIRDLLRDDFTRKVVAGMLLDLRKDVSGSAQDRLFELFQDLNLHKESFKKLKSWRWERISKGIRELTQMEVSDSYRMVAKFINDRRSIVRKQAEIGVVALNDEGINHFLDTTRHKISEWQQLKLMEVLSNKTDFVPPSFKAWLTSTNKFVVLFTLRLIKYYAQNDAKASIIELLKHKDDQIKRGAIDCVRAFNIIEALPTLKKVFWACTSDIKIAILDTIGTLGSVNDFVFLNSIENKECNYSVTSKALSTINAIKPGSILPTQGITDIHNIEVPDDIVLEEREETASLRHEGGIEVEESSEEIAMDNLVHRQLHISNEPESEEQDQHGEESIKEEVSFSMDFIPLVVETETNWEREGKQETLQAHVNNIDVVYEEVLTRYDPREISGNNLNINSIEVVASDLEFLPIVVADHGKEEDRCIDINNLVVDFEMVPPTTIPVAEIEVVDVKGLFVHYEEVRATHKEKKLEDIQVIYEEVPPSEIKISFDLKDHLSEHFDFEVIFDNDMPPLRIPKIETSELFNIEVDVEEVAVSCASLAEMRVVGELVTGNEIIEESEEDLPLWLLNEIAEEDPANIDNGHLKMGGSEWDAKESQMMDTIRSYFKLIPKSEPNDGEVTESIQLLDDLALFGDEREIPLLQELMEKENQNANKARIDGLMRRFTGNDAYGSTPADSTPYSVFEELFRNCDLESKLILLDEIVLVGDGKEIHFLKQLVSDSNQKIAEKAKRSLELLSQRLERIESGREKSDADEYERFINMMELMPPRESGIFNIDFEITQEEKIGKGTNKKTGGFTSFISSLLNKLTS